VDIDGTIARHVVSTQIGPIERAILAKLRDIDQRQGSSVLSGDAGCFCNARAGLGARPETVYAYNGLIRLP
ncbi:hypothetical protein, partial [Bradyrhizobium sp.]|uniref:hypothetical protein n=1 Tax=Bradyrhizobium sp. TaxID=376 RepID=UPI003C268BC6